MSEFLARRRIVLTMAALAVLFGAFFQLSAPLRASQGARITADEPFYLMTTHSLWTDGDIDLRDEYAKESYRLFYDHTHPLWHQSLPRSDGQELAPHQVGLSLLVLPAYAIGGLDAVKAFLGALGGLAVALTFLLAYRLSGRYWESLAGTGIVATAAPVFIFASQIYPEMPAALLTVAGLNLVTLKGRMSIMGAIIAAGCVIGLPWLGVKYLPATAVLAAAALLQARGRPLACLSALLAIGAATYAWFHLSTYGDLTPYSVNAIYAGDGTASIVDQHFSFSDRMYRLSGLWIDREFGLVRWAPAMLLAVPGAYFAVTRTPRAGLTIAAALAGQLFVAAFVAITMRGYWFPGRQMVVVLPLVAVFASFALVEWRHFAVRAAVWLAAAYGLALTLVLRAATASREVTLAVDPFEMDWFGFQKPAPFFPLYTAYGLDTWVLTVIWCSLVGGILIAAWRTAPVHLRLTLRQPVPRFTFGGARRGLPRLGDQQ